MKVPVHEASDLRSLRQELEALRSLAARDRGLLDAILDHSPHGILVSDATGKLILANRAARVIWGGARAAEVEPDWTRCRAFHPDGRPYADGDFALARSLHGKETVAAEEVRIQRFDGTFATVLASSAPITGPGGEVQGALSVFADITALKEALTANELRYRQVLDSVGDIVFVKDRELRVRFANRATSAFYGKGVEELHGKITLPGRLGGQASAEVFRTGRSVAVMQEPIVGATGETHYFDTVTSPVFGPDGEVREVVGVARDVTDRRRAERRSNANHAVARVLAEADTVEEVLRPLLDALAPAVDAEIAELWVVREGGTMLGRDAVWPSPGLSDAHRASTRGPVPVVLPRGAGLPGLAMERGEPVWIADVGAEPALASPDVAGEELVRTAFACPVALRRDLFGVLVFYGTTAFRPDDELVQLVLTVSRQLGQFVERTRARGELRASEAVKTAILESALDAVITIDGRGIVREFNAAAERMFGYTRAEAIHRDVADLIVPAPLRDAQRRGIVSNLAGGEAATLPRRVELPAVRRNGDALVLEASITPIYAGHEALFTAFLRDISAEKAAEEQSKLMTGALELLASSLDVETVLASLARLAVPRIAGWCAVDVLRPDGSLHRVAVAHSDPSKVELARDLYRKYPPRDQNRGVLKVLRTGETEWAPFIPEEVIVEAAGDDEVLLRILRELGLQSYIVVPLVARGRVLAALSLVHDTPGRRYSAADVRFAEDLARRAALSLDNARLYHEAQRTAAALREETEALETLHAVGAAIAAELDVEKLVQAVTDAATELSGAEFGAFFYNVIAPTGEAYMLYALSGAPKDAFAKFPMPRNTPLFAATFRGEGVVRLDDVTQDPRYGTMTPHLGMPEGHLPVRSYLAVPVRSRSGEVLGGLFLGHGSAGVFTERAEKLVVGVASQAAVAVDNARLFQQAQRLITALERSNRELDQFAYVTSHDLKAPLRGIASLSEWLEEDLGPGLAPESKRQLALLRGRVSRMEGLIQGILEYSRAARVRGKSESVDLRVLLDETLELLSPPAEARIEVEGPLPTLLTEKVPLQQVLMNLVGNALKHARRTDQVVRITCVDRGSRVELAVSDNGPGIAPEYHERIWGIFQTLEARDKVESTGIGLAIVRKIVESRGGKAWVESTPGAGATFRFDWPKRE